MRLRVKPTYLDEPSPRGMGRVSAGMAVPAVSAVSAPSERNSTARELGT